MGNEMIFEEVEEIVEENRLRKENKELLNFTYDSNASKTRDIKTLLKDKKGICFDFVNYLYHKYGKKGKCYFMWFNNKQGSTHTIYITEDNYYIEATPEEGKPLDYIYIKKVTDVLEIAKNMADQIATGYWKNSPKFRICKYVPKNVSQTIDQFIDERWIDGHFDD